MTSGSYTRTGPPARGGRASQPAGSGRQSQPSPGGQDSLPGGGRAQPIGPGFAAVMVASIFTTAVLLVLALVYYLGSAGRIASDYTAVASPANAALSAERADYTRDSGHNLAAAESDLRRMAQTVNSFATNLDTVSFPAGAATTAEDALVTDGQKLAKLLGQQAKAHTLTQMLTVGATAGATAAAAETQARDLRRALGLPPPSAGTVF